MMISIEKVRDDLKSLSEKISDLTKTIALGVLALCWLMLMGGKESPVLPAPANSTLLIFAACASLLSLVCGYLQFLFGYGCSKGVHDEAERAKVASTEYDDTSVLYRLRDAFFWIKQALAGLAVLLFFSVVVISYASA